MKLTHFQLEAHLNKKLAPVYLVGGEEVLLKQDAVRLIKQAALTAGYTEQIRIVPDSGYDWDQLFSILQAASLFSEKRIIEFNFQQHVPNKTAGTILRDYAQNPSPSQIVLITLGKIDEKTSKSHWYTALEKIGIALTLWPIPREQFPQWVIQRAKKHNVTLLPEAAHILADLTEGNLSAAVQAIEKINLLNVNSPINAATIQTLLVDESHFSIFDFVENLISGSHARALHILENLQGEGTEPAIILWGIVRELRLLAELSQLRQQGSTWESLFQTHRIFNRRQTAIKQFLTCHSISDCWEYLAHAAQIDKIIKGALTGNIWQSLQLFCLRM